MSTLERYLLGGVAAIRPYLFARVFLLMLAADIWIDFLVSSARYGVGGFDVAHFDWMDAIGPVPTASLHIAILTAASFALWVCAIGGLHRPLLGVACVLFTYGWAMSQHDSFQHHYLLSLILLCVVFMPKATTAEVAREPGRLVGAWAYVMLGVEVAIVYLWTAIAKMDAMWIGGHTVRRLLLGEHEESATADSTMLWALSKTNAWSVFAVSAIIFELLLMAGYVFAVGQDRRQGRAGRWTCVSFWLIAVMLHAGILFMPLRIGIFSYYMLLAASVFLLPLGAIRWLGAAVTWPAKGVVGVMSRLPGGAGACVAMAVVAAGALVGAGYAVDLPGAQAGAVIAAAMLLVSVVWDASRGATEAGRMRVAASGLFAVLMLGASYGMSLPYHFYALAAQAHHFTGDSRDAAGFYRLAIAHAPAWAADSQLYNNYAELLQQMSRLDEAAANYQTAIRINPADAFAHSNLAKLLMQTGKADEALQHFGKAVEAKPDDAVLLCDFAYALQSRQRPMDAIKLYRLAAKIDPEALRAHNNLATMLLGAGKVADAVPHLRQVIRLDDRNVEAMNNLAWILATSKERTASDAKEAVVLASRATGLTENKDPVVLATLAEAHSAAGDPKQAVATMEQAIEVARSQNLPGVVTKLGARLVRYKQAGGN